YWKEQGCSTEHAAVGELMHFSRLPSLPDSDPHIRLYGGMRFNRKQQDPLWERFDAERFWVPECELLRTENENRCFVHSLGNPSYIPHPPLTAGTLESPSILQRIDLPEKEQWEETLGKILLAIAEHRLEKVVSARKTELKLHHPLSIWPLMKQLRSRSFNTTLFAFALGPDLCFFGSSPEKLFERKGQHLFTEAVAGTRRRAQIACEDERLAAELLNNVKDKREFTIVKQFLERKLSAYIESFSWDGEDRILQNTHVQHIYNRLCAKLHPSVSDAELLDCLHPTPALGGVPSAVALEMIEQLEPFDRG
ncbi:MAG: chorismate-binding protein, partial [Chlamydiota bacterium]